MSEILEQQRAFAEAYVLGGGNATKAAVEAGYSAISARQTASRLLHTPHVQDAIRRAQAHALKDGWHRRRLGSWRRFSTTKRRLPAFGLMPRRRSLIGPDCPLFEFLKSRVTTGSPCPRCRLCASTLCWIAHASPGRRAPWKNQALASSRSTRPRRFRNDLRAWNVISKDRPTPTTEVARPPQPPIQTTRLAWLFALRGAFASGLPFPVVP
jgi:hypothetical protein